MYRYTKIIATVGPATESAEQLLALMDAGVDIFRLNFSHGDLEEKDAVIRKIKDLSRGHKKVTAILADLQGPKIRIGKFKNGFVDLHPGRQVTITTRHILGDEGIIPTTYQNLPADVKIGNRILLDEGLIEFLVKSVSDPDITCQVISGGTLSDHKGINLPGVSISAPALTEKDKLDIEFCVRAQVDFIALSFVRKATDVEELKKILQLMDSDIPVIAKIEKPEAITDFDTILSVADAIMVARGDLGVEMTPEKVPLLQKSIISKCNQIGKPVITATQMLESMVSHQQPTRAETSDVANAVLDGTDAVMLSGETAIGKYPSRAVMTINRIALDIEKNAPQQKIPVWRVVEGSQLIRSGLPEAIGKAACRAAEEVGAVAILAFTQTGKTAALVAKYRPACPIYAVTPSENVQRRMCLYRGVSSLLVAIQNNTDSQIEAVETAVLASGLLKSGDVVVITMGSPLSTPGTTNLLKIHQFHDAQID